MNYTTKVVLFSLMAVATSAQAYHSSHGDLTLQDTKQLTLDGRGLSQLKIEAGAGTMSVVGGSGQFIEVKAEIYQKSAHSDYCLSLSNTNAGGLLKAGNCDNNQHYDSDKQTAINLTVTMPESLSLSIADGSGPIKVFNVGATEIHDGSGDITVEKVAGDLVIHDGSGGIEVSLIEGSTSVHDGSGPIMIKQVMGNVDVTDGSSSMTILDVKGKVAVSDGSGSIVVNGAGSFTLLSDGSGSVSVENVAGAVSM